MDPNEQQLKPTQASASEEGEAEQQQQQSAPKSNSIFGEDDKPVYRSIKLDSRVPSAVPPPLGMGFMKSSPFMPTGVKSAATIPVQAKSQAPKVQVAVMPKLTDKTNYSKATPRDLPTAPFHLEKNSHFKIEGSTMRVCTIIGSKLAELGSDFNFKDEKCKWKVEFYNGSQRSKFNVSLYKSDEDTYVELQRREGDLLSFLKAYREVFEVCQKYQLLVGEKPPVAAKRKLPPSKKATPSEAQMKPVVSSVQGMISSKFIDVQIQGAQAINSLAQNNLCSKFLAPTVSSLLTLTRSTHSTVQRISGAALSALMKDPVCVNALVESDGWLDIINFASGRSTNEKELRRECMYIFSKLCPSHATKMADFDGAQYMIDVLNRPEDIVDIRTKHHAFTAKQSLRSSGILAS